MATEPRVAQVKHAANVDNLNHLENAQHMAENVKNAGIKTISVCFVGPGTEKIPETETTMN